MFKVEWERAVRNAYASITEFRRLGFERIEVSGGDPLEFDGLPDYIRALKKAGFRWVRVSTNGVRLSDRRFAQSLLDAGVDVFRIPLYGSTARAHDEVTRVPGSFEATVKGLRYLRKVRKAKLLLISLLMEQTKDDLTGIFDLMQGITCDDCYFSPVFISNRDYSYYVPHFQQGRYFRQLVRHAHAAKRFLRIRDLPYCVLGADNDFTSNNQWPAFLGQHFQPGPDQRTATADLPNYRRKIKLEICQECVVSHKCHGFLVNDILKYGIGQLKPILSRKKIRLPEPPYILG